MTNKLNQEQQLNKNAVTGSVYKILNLYACLGGNRYKWDEVAKEKVIINSKRKERNQVRNSLVFLF